MENENIWTRLREVLSNVSLKTYLYAIGVMAVLIAILINVTGPSKYGSVHKDGKFYLNIDQIAADYGLDLSEDGDIGSVDYTNSIDHNLTQDLSQSLLLTNMFLDQNGLTDPTAKGQILANIILEYQKQAKGKIYTEKDLNVIRNDDLESIREYYTDINRALTNYKKSIQNLNLTDISQYSSNPSEENIVSMKAAITSNALKKIAINNSFINDLISIPTTSTGATYQLQLINLISQQNVYIKSLLYIDTDPAKYVLNNGESFEQKFDSDISSIIDSFNNYFRSSGL